MAIGATAGRAVVTLPGALGRRGVDLAGEAGRVVLFWAAALRGAFRPQFRGRHVIHLARRIGDRSATTVALAGALTGIALVLHGYSALIDTGRESLVGPLVSLGLVRELGPVLAALAVAARAAPAITAELAEMRAGGHVDALEAAGLDPRSYLATPRMVASLVAVPLAVTLFVLCAMVAGCLFAEGALGLHGDQFVLNTRSEIGWGDLSVGLIKALAFGALLAWLSTYRGLHAGRDARSARRAAARTVIELAVIIAGGDYLLTALFS